MKSKVYLLMWVSFLFLTRINAQSVNTVNCLKLTDHKTCACCRSGYSGQSCNGNCENCLSRLSPEGDCIYYCISGFYGRDCDRICPKTCADTAIGQHTCQEKNGVLICVGGCIPGFYGAQCNRSCHGNCLNYFCHQSIGKCSLCSSSRYYGDQCNIPCNKECKYETCDRSGKCRDGCKDGYYGDDCKSQCGRNCLEGRCISDMNHTFSCTQGCKDGYYGEDCTSRCGRNCLEDRCISDMNYTFSCTKGCKDGYYGEDCTSQCGNKCLEGRCITDIKHTYSCTKGCQVGYKGVTCSVRCTAGLDGCNLHVTHTSENVKVVVSWEALYIIFGIMIFILVVIVILIIVIISQYVKKKNSKICISVKKENDRNPTEEIEEEAVRVKLIERKENFGQNNHFSPVRDIVR